MENFLETQCEFEALRIGMAETTQPFFCGDADLDGFFHEDFRPYEDELMGKSYCFVRKDNRQIVAAFTVSNGSIHNRLLSSSAKKHLSKNISEEKRSINYPAVLIGRLGVNKELKRQNIGTDVMKFIKQWFVMPDNKTGCRYLLVDAYNREETLNYYLRNGFSFIFSNLESEKRPARMLLRQPVSCAPHSGIRQDARGFDFVEPAHARPFKQV